MKQGAAFLAGITLVVATTPLAAGEPPALPLPTGMTGGAPPASALVLYGRGIPAETTRSSWRDRFNGLSLFGKSDCESRGRVQVKPQWCTNCAPAFRHPLPPLPPGMTTATAAVPMAASEPACREHHSGDCWNKIKAWLCYRQTPVHLPCTPTPRYPPLFTLFPCKENCGAVGAGYDISRKDLLHGKHGSSSCTTCPAPAEQILPGYRFAAPQAPTEPVAPPAPTTSTYRPGR